MRRFSILILALILSACANLGPSEFASNDVCTKRAGDKSCFIKP